MTRPAEYWKKRAEANMDRVQEGAEQHLARLVSHTTPDLRGMLQTMDTVWAGGNYSARIWKNTERLAETLSSEIEAAFLSGKSVRRMADTIMERFGVGYRTAECLVRTETSYVQNRTAARSYEDAGCTEYEVLTAQDRRTCQYCAKQNGKRYLLATMQAGENAPPFHPNCRCTILPVVGEDKQLAKKAGPEELGFAVAKTGTAIEERIKLESSSPIRKEIQLEGITFPLKVNPEKQARHMAGDKSYIPGRSVITLPMKKIQELVYEKAGSGTIDRMNAEQIQEILDFEIEVGYTVNRKGEAAKTSFVKIHYSKTGVHVVPYSGKKEK